MISGFDAIARDLGQFSLRRRMSRLLGGVAAAGSTEPTEELTEPGTNVVLEPGDVISYEDDVVHTARGAGDEETVAFWHAGPDERGPSLDASRSDIVSVV